MKTLKEYLMESSNLNDLEKLVGKAFINRQGDMVVLDDIMKDNGKHPLHFTVHKHVQGMNRNDDNYVAGYTTEPDGYAGGAWRTNPKHPLDVDLSKPIDD